MERQQDLLIAVPLKIAAKHAPFDVVVFVLDALNEGLNERQVKEMITHLAFISDKLRPQVNLKVMITCRPTDHIIGLIGEPNVECVSVVSDLDSSAGSSIPFASLEEIATSIDELASSLPIFQQSAIDIAEQASLRVCAFNTWAENSRQHREHISNDVFDSLEARYEAHQQLLALRLRQTSMLEMLSSHLDIVKRLFLLVSNIGSASNATVENLLTDFIIAWIIITDADELKAALNIDERSKANSAFVKAFALDMRKLRKKQSMKQATMSISKSILDEIFRGLWDQLSERFGTLGTEIESQLEEHQLPLPKLVEVAGERFPVLHEIQQALSLLPSNSNPHATLVSRVSESR
ncbi:hypothetical protein FRC02_012211 [Tulasnella sp. 418]|nr:hypothetical protein FRC02_012211 [Tulasnella sp. 418]